MRSPSCGGNIPVWPSLRALIFNFEHREAAAGPSEGSIKNSKREKSAQNVSLNDNREKSVFYITV